MKNEKNFYTVGHLEIKQDLIKAKPLWYLSNSNDEGITKIFKQLKGITGYQYDNRYLKWSNIYGHMFVISIYLVKDMWEITLWNHTGVVHITRVVQRIVDKQTDVLSDENYKKICEATEDYVRDIIKCSDCGEKIKKQDVAGHYFASSFCESCWTGKWKAIEAKETYS